MLQGVRVPHFDEGPIILLATIGEDSLHPDRLCAIGSLAPPLFRCRVQRYLGAQGHISGVMLCCFNLKIILGLYGV